MTDWLRTLFTGRPWWMNALMVFCGYMAFFYVPWDLFVKPVARDQEVWFGVLFTGAAAKALAVPHWAVYALGAYGFRHMRPWMHPWASLYVLQIAVGMLVWSLLQDSGGFGGAVVGVVAFALFAGLAAALWRARPLFRGPRPSLKERYGEWALVTGASAGIGAEFARALAREGLSVVLTARRAERLRDLASELEKQHQMATRCIAVDLSLPGGADELADAVSDLEIAVLVNNAGAGYAGRFSKQEVERLAGMVTLNCAAPVVLTSRLLPGMRSRGSGAVIVTGSVAGHQGLPLHAVYSATKAFDLLFGEALFVELQDEGIDVVVLEPGSTETEFQQVAGEIAHSGQTSAEVVRAALDALGRQPVVISGWFNWLRANLATRVLPRSVVGQVARGVIEKQTPAEMR